MTKFYVEAKNRKPRRLNMNETLRKKCATIYNPMGPSLPLRSDRIISSPFTFLTVEKYGKNSFIYTKYFPIVLKNARSNFSLLKLSQVIEVVFLCMYACVFEI